MHIDSARADFLKYQCRRPPSSRLLARASQAAVGYLNVGKISVATYQTLPHAVYECLSHPASLHVNDVNDFNCSLPLGTDGYWDARSGHAIAIDACTPCTFLIVEERFVLLLRST
jgi:hypothetical protein